MRPSPEQVRSNIDAYVASMLEALQLARNNELGPLVLPRPAQNPFFPTQTSDDELKRQGRLPVKTELRFAGDYYFRSGSIGASTHHPDRLEVEPCQLIFFWLVGTCNTN